MLNTLLSQLAFYLSRNTSHTFFFSSFLLGLTARAKVKSLSCLGFAPLGNRRLVVPLLCREIYGSPKFPDYPFEYMPRTQTPLVSCSLALTLSGLLPSDALKSLAFVSAIPGTILCPRLYIFRDSITQPVFLFPLAPYSRCRICTQSSLLTCWLGFSQVGLAPTG